jgi:fibronectin type 3 domain-containing protein
MLYLLNIPMNKPNINILHLLFIIVIIVISLNAFTAFASVVTIFWDAPTTNADGAPLNDLAGYKIYYGTSERNYSSEIDAGNVTNYMVSNLKNGVVYYFAVTAYDTSGNESDYSNEERGRAVSVCECNLISNTIVIQRGGTLVFQATVTNYTDESGTVLFATNATEPDGSLYLPSGYLIGPIEVTLNPYGSKSEYLSHIVPADASLGTYTYHGYVGNYGVGIYDECQFNVEVTE